METILGICLAFILFVGVFLVLTNPSVMRALSFGHGGGVGTSLWVSLQRGVSRRCRVVGYGKHDTYAVVTPSGKLIFAQQVPAENRRSGNDPAWQEISDELDKLDHWLGRPWPYDPNAHAR